MRAGGVSDFCGHRITLIGWLAGKCSFSGIPWNFPDNSAKVSPMRGVITAVLVLCLALGLVDGPRNAPHVAKTCQRGMAHCPSHESRSGDGVPCVPCPANCPLCSILGAASVQFPDAIIVRIVIDRGPADIGCLGDRLTYPPQLPPPRVSNGEINALSTLNLKLES
jgi:hypothetical protein